MEIDLVAGADPGDGLGRGNDAHGPSLARGMRPVKGPNHPGLTRPIGRHLAGNFLHERATEVPQPSPGWCLATKAAAWARRSRLSLARIELT